MQMGPWQILLILMIVALIILLTRRGGKRRRDAAESQPRIATALEDIARQKQQD